MSGGGQEIVTLQFGNFSNHLCAHYFNIEDEHAVFHSPDKLQELDSNRLFRCGHTAKGQPTYTPRTVLFDLTGGLGSLSHSGNVYANTTSVESLQNISDALSSASGLKTQVFPSDQFDKNPYQRRLDMEDRFVEQRRQEAEQKRNDPFGLNALLGVRKKPAATSNLITEDELKQQKALSEAFNFDTSVRFWTDYLKVQIHPKSIYEIPSLHYNCNNFQIFDHGQQLMANVEQAEEMFDRVRYFTEECDRLDGFQCFIDIDSGFGGIASSYLQELRDEYPSRAMISLLNTPYVDPKSVKQDFFTQRALNTGFSIVKLWDVSSSIVPLNAQNWDSQLLPHLGANRSSHFQTSALMGAAIHNATTPYRLNSRIREFDMHDFVHRISPFPAQKFLSLNMSLPFGYDSSTRLISKSIEETLVIPQLKDLERTRHLHHTNLTQNLSHSLPLNEKSTLNSSWTVLRGSKLLPRDKSSNLPPNAPLDMRMEHDNSTLIKYLASRPRCLLSNSTFVEEPLPIPLPFPKFSNVLGAKSPVLSHLYSSSEESQHLMQLYKEFENASKDHRVAFYYSSENLTLDRDLIKDTRNQFNDYIEQTR